jgi:DNA polymerase elongation subunit (family B)
MADRRGHARVWRRVDGHVVYEEARFPNWLLLSYPELLRDLPVTEVSAVSVRDGLVVPDGAIYIARLEGTLPFSVLVMTNRLDEVEAQLTEAARRAIDSGGITQPLSNILYVRPAEEQYLTITGRTYFTGMTYDDVRRLQFDLETTGLGPNDDQIFMVSIKDSDGFATTYDVGRMSEADLIRELARTIVERDPDVIENHNIFDFDIRFLLKRAQALAIALPLARDGTGFVESRDSVRIGDKYQSFTRYGLAGREIVDTLHATRRLREVNRDLRSGGLKEAARYLGVASEDREYITGAEIWRTFQEDPERVRRYCWDDVDEVDRISRLLLSPSFALTSIVPKRYERVATAGTGQPLVEPLLVRTYLAAGHSLPTAAVAARLPDQASACFTTGVVDYVVQARVTSLYPTIMRSQSIAPAADLLNAFPTILAHLDALSRDHKEPADLDTADDRGQMVAGLGSSYDRAMRSAVTDLSSSFYSVLGIDYSMFSDRAAADRVAARGREVVDQLLAELARKGALLVMADTDRVLFGMPPRSDGQLWTVDEEQVFVDELGKTLPVGIQLAHDGRYRAMYSYAEENYALLRYQAEPPPGFRARDVMRIVGPALTPPRSEPYIERFFGRALRVVLEGNPSRLRSLYRDEWARLYAREVPVAELCVSMPLTKTVQAYLQGDRKEEPYEVYLAAGYTSWQTGVRIQYYQSTSGKRLLRMDATDYDPEFYAARLRQVMIQRLDRALSQGDLDILLSVQDGLFDPPLASIRVLCQQRSPDLALVSEEPTAPQLL